MVENPNTKHERFGELSALAIIGQVSPEEDRELRAHLESCAVCRQEYDALADILLSDLPLAHAEEDFALEPAAVMQAGALSSRYVAGTVPPSFEYRRKDANRPPRWWEKLRRPPTARLTYAYVAAFLLFGTAGGLAFWVVRDSKIEISRSSQMARLSAEVLALRNQIQDRADREKSSSFLSRETAEKSDKTGPSSPGPHESKLLTRNRELERQLQSAREEISGLREQANSGAEQESQLTARLAEAQQKMDHLSADLKILEGSHAQDGAIIENQQDQLRQMEEKLAAARDSMERNSKFLVADRDIRDLMGARNLRIVDVFDVDSKGKTRKPFGRVFFTEGKSLIFYAFDLGDERPGFETAAYQAWGAEGALEHGARSLGIFYRDDQRANRWVLKFEDPDVLAEIDSVFVTIEPPGGSKKPTGGKLLAAYVKANLNHP